MELPREPRLVEDYRRWNCRIIPACPVRSRRSISITLGLHQHHLTFLFTFRVTGFDLKSRFLPAACRVLRRAERRIYAPVTPRN